MGIELAVVGGGGVVTGGVDPLMGGELTGGGVPTSGALLRTVASSVVEVVLGWFVVLRCAVELVDDGSGGNSGGYAVKVGSADDDVSGIGTAIGDDCRLPDAVAAMVANPVAMAIPAVAHTTSRFGRASGSSRLGSIGVPCSLADRSGHPAPSIDGHVALDMMTVAIEGNCSARGVRSEEPDLLR